MLKVSGESAFGCVETVAKAGRGDIECEGTSPVEVNGRNAAIACLTLYRWSDPQHWIGSGRNTVFNWQQDWPSVPDEEWSGSQPDTLVASWLDEMSGDTCLVRSPAESCGTWPVGFLGECASDSSPVPWHAFLPANIPFEGPRIMVVQQ